MKYVNSIILLICLVFCFEAGKGQAIVAPTSSYPQLSYYFSARDLSLDQIKVFSGRAVQKLNDLGGYLSILSNPDYDPVFREKAEGMIRSSFLDVGKEGGTLVLEHPFSRSSISLGSFLNFFGSADASLFFVPQFSDIEDGNTPFWHEDGYYVGELVFQFTLNRIHAAGNAPEEKGLWYKIEYRIAQHTKQFGDQEKAVWEVFRSTH